MAERVGGAAGAAAGRGGVGETVPGGDKVEAAGEAVKVARADGTAPDRTGVVDVGRAVGAAGLSGGGEAMHGGPVCAGAAVVAAAVRVVPVEAGLNATFALGAPPSLAGRLPVPGDGLVVGGLNGVGGM